MQPLDTTYIPHTEPLRREWIKFQLRGRGSSLAQISRELGISRAAPINTLKDPYPKIEAVIAAKIGVKPQAIWPERYGPDGKSNRSRGRTGPRKSINKDSTRRRSPSIQAGAGR